ncbi:MAG: hypothetical protein G3M78_07730 [Candidatus Nitrohelix vancouverensis]|uniref:Glycosyltransferase RgtA/B/C/D-like domain-containing protein n=1 Tax=Candidatus Nitrohelix vancouverensis TaxID=2705534 RepID=A0A7T0C2D5_9BACT|nr:MAG: hypothetical protein G3M78_07730 [Candidatus Nitrohelix vancouverensis]
MLVLAPIELFFFIIYQKSVGIPFSSDWEILPFVMSLEGTEQIHDKLALFIPPSSEHHLTPAKLVFSVAKIFNPMLNIKTALLLSNSLLLGLFILFVMLIPRKHEGLILPATIAWILFQMQHWALMSHSAEAAQYFSIIVFAGWAFYFVNHHLSLAITGSFFFGGLSMLGSNTGILVMIVLGIHFLQHHKRILAVTLCSGAAFLIILSILYFGAPDIVSSVGDILRHPVSYLYHFFSFIGATLSIDNAYFGWFAPWGGLTAIIYFIILTRNKFYLTNPAIYYFMLFIILVACSEASLLVSDNSTHALDSKYRIFSTSFLILIVLTIAVKLSSEDISAKTRFSCYTLFVAVLLNLASYYSNITNIELRSKQLTSAMQTVIMEDAPVKTGRQEDPQKSQILQLALNKYFYKLPCRDIFSKSDFKSLMLSPTTKPGHYCREAH